MRLKLMSVKANVFIEFVNSNIGLTDYNKFNNFTIF